MEKTMLALVFEGNGKYSLKELDVPKIKKPDDVLLKVLCATICGTDIQILKVPPGHPATKGVILGHEYVAEVLEMGANCSGLSAGDRVAIDPNITCGCCSYCQTGRHNMCSRMTTLGIFVNGGFAKYNVAPASQLYRYPSSLAPEKAVFAEPLSCVLNAFNKIKLSAGENVVVLGAGPIGQYFIQLARVSGAGLIIASEPSGVRRRVAKQSGANFVVDPNKQDIVKFVFSKMPDGAEVVIDAVGNMLELAEKISARGARIMLFGQQEKARASIAQNKITRKELTVIGSYISLHSFPQAIRLLQSENFRVDHLITHRLKLSQIEKGISAMRSGRAMKVLVFPD